MQILIQAKITYIFKISTFSMWRIKSHEFNQKGVVFDINKFMQLSDISVRLMFTRYDHLSPRHPFYFPKEKPPSAGTVTASFYYLLII